MPIQLNAQPLADFDRPIDVLEDCHRRIEGFLAMLQEVLADTTDDGRMTEDAAQALHVALRYFRNAAPKHTADEEESLFPRMRASGDPRVEPLLARLAELETDHDEAERLHELVDRIGLAWLETGVLELEDRVRLATAITILRDTYQRHIRTEDTLVFPLAREVLGSEDQTGLAREMRERRALPR